MTAPQTAPGAVLPATLRLGPAHLTVADLDRSVAFYQDAIGLHLHRRDRAVAALGTGGEDLLVLHEESGARPAGRHAGLYHFALLYPSREELARAVQRLAVTRTPIDGASDHGVSEAIYLPDPDGNGIELYADRPSDAWPEAGPGEKVGMFTRALDVHALLATVGEDEPGRHAGAGLRMGHMHLHVGDLEAARAFYVDLLGFEVMVGMPSALFLAAGGYHHHLGVNTWRGPGVGPAPAGTAGLREWTLVLDPEPLAALRERLAAAGLGDGDVVEDPWGIRLRLADAGAVRSRAVVATDKPSPYLLQLAKHFRHKLPVEFDEQQATIPLAFGAVDLTAEDGRLVLDARAAEPGGLARVEAVIGSHLERFGRRDELAVTWEPRA